MKNKKNIRNTVFAFLLIGLWLARYFSFNAKIAKLYTTPQLFYSKNEAVEYGSNIINLHTYTGCNIMLRKAQLFDAVDFFSKFNVKPMLEATVLGKAQDEKVCVLQVDFTNNSNYHREFDLGDLLIRGEDTMFGILNCVGEINRSLCLNENSKLKAEPGETLMVQIPVLIIRNTFSDSEWARINEYKLYLVVTQFPEEQTIRIEYD